MIYSRFIIIFVVAQLLHLYVNKVNELTKALCSLDSLDNIWKLALSAVTKQCVWLSTGGTVASAFA